MPFTDIDAWSRSSKDINGTHNYGTKSIFQFPIYIPNTSNKNDIYHDGNLSMSEKRILDCVNENRRCPIIGHKSAIGVGILLKFFHFECSRIYKRVLNLVISLVYFLYKIINQFIGYFIMFGYIPAKLWIFSWMWYGLRYTKTWFFDQIPILE